MSNKYVTLTILFLMYGCSSTVHLVNTAHLDHLYKERLIEGKVIGTQWIYCEAPTYALVSDDDEGYTCVDDVARALVFYCRALRQKPTEYNLHKVETLSNFLLYMQADNGYFYNFMLTDGQINKTHKNSLAMPAFWSWRAYWALTELLMVKDIRLQSKQQQCEAIVSQLEVEIANLCNDMHGMQSYDGILMSSCIGSIGSDQMAEILKGLSNHYGIKPNKILKSTIESIGHLVMQTQVKYGFKSLNYFFLSWQNYWHAWGNSQSYALIKAGTAICDTTMTLAALKEINGFYKAISMTGHMTSFKLSILPNGNFQVTEERLYEQISYGISPMIFATVEAYHCTKDESYADLAFVLASWYFGNNIASATMYDVKTGRCYDGINNFNQINVNSGAESTIEALLAMQSLESLSSIKIKYKSFIKKYLSQNQVTKSN
jgi:hypothetical protein